ncbi:hypothetical protein EH240_12665 [Mesorhizobium tamadayense]|uniref:Uncharacterized protein n=1 Tax=Mesorhizobium tamadayense TaxID=425306 RepID=A0A3P3FW55_9HYPH|nr:hypothetical protein [Mesorhizobium tamadayense]RRI02313.1 hypothetical protein EH240_12665 [Mesorhizobium tamadayense]
MRNWVLKALVAGLFFLPVASSFAQEPPFDWSDEQDMTFAGAYNGGNCNGCEWIVAEGTIVGDSSSKFLDYLTQRFGSPDKAVSLTVHFNSPGGDVLEAIKIGRIIREWGLDTSIGKTTGVLRDGLVYSDFPSPGVCASACAYAVLGGSKRYLSDARSKLGVHQHYSPKSVEKPLELTASAVDRSLDQLFTAIILEYVVSMGVDPEYAVLAQSTSPFEMRWLTEEERTDLQADNTADQYSEAKIIPFGSRGAAVEIEHTKGVFANLATPAKFRVYCRGDSATPHLVAIITDKFDFEDAMRTAVASNIDFKVTNELGLNITVHPKFAGLEAKKNADNTHTVAAAWSLPGLSREVLSEATAVQAVDSVGKSVPHYAFDLETMLAFSFPNAGPLMQLALRNCVQ